MNMLQHYYTSFLNQRTGTSGFQVKAMSPDISAETQNLILRLISYRIPSGLDERAPSTHPCALRYYPCSQHESLLICSQSIGEDPNGRPGNFFAHTLVVPPEVFTTIPPVLYWKSAFWLTADPSSRVQLESLSDFPADPALSGERIWDFLHTRGRLNFFVRLMSAVVQGTAGRRIIIVDSDEHTALWIAALSCLLPPAYRPLLSFTTYHHDPYQSLFFITGVSPSAGLRLTPEDYVSYFIVNAHEDRVSEIALSPYAQQALRFASPGHGENELLNFFSHTARRFPAPATLDDRLDLMVSYAQVMQGARAHASPPDLQAIELVLQTFEQSCASEPQESDPQDLTDLQALASFLWQTYEASRERAAHRLFDRVVMLLQRARAPTSSIFEKQLLYHTRQLLPASSASGQQTDALLTATLAGLAQVRATCGQQEFRRQVNRPEYLRVLSALAGQSHYTRLTHMWMSIGPDLLPGPEMKAVLVRSIQAWNAARDGELWQALDAVLCQDRKAWLGLLVSPLSPLIEGVCASAFYYACVCTLSLAQRVPYREILRSVLPDILSREVGLDLGSGEVQTALPRMQQWLDHIREAAPAESPSAVLACGLQSLSQSLSQLPQAWAALACQFLADEQCSRLLENTWVAQLFAAAFAQLSLASSNPQVLALAQRYAHHPGLPERSRLILRTCLALASQQLQEQDIAELSSYMRSLSPEQYIREVRHCCQVFFTSMPGAEQHTRFLTVFYCIHQAQSFWSLYWDALFTLPPPDTVHLLTCWFNGQTEQSLQIATVQYFLLSFWKSLLAYRKQAAAQKTIELLTQCPWYQALEQGSLLHKQTLLTRGQDLLKQMHRRLPRAREGAEEKMRQELQENIRPLFAREQLRRRHQELLPQISGNWAAAIFWDAYGEYVSTMLSEADAPQLLEFLCFWCDDAFSSQSQIRALARCILVNLPLALEHAAKINTAHLTEILPPMEQLANAVNPPYSWYPQIKSLLAPPPARAQVPRQLRGQQGDTR